MAQKAGVISPKGRECEECSKRYVGSTCTRRDSYIPNTTKTAHRNVGFPSRESCKLGEIHINARTGWQAFSIYAENREAIHAHSTAVNRFEAEGIQQGIHSSAISPKLVCAWHVQDRYGGDPSLPSPGPPSPTLPDHHGARPKHKRKRVPSQCMTNSRYASSIPRILFQACLVYYRLTTDHEDPFPVSTVCHSGCQAELVCSWEQVGCTR